MAPSLVTWPTSSTAMPRRLASSTSACAEPRTWLTVPGVLSIVSSHMVWMESITATLGASGRSRVATMSRTEVAAGELHRRVAQAQPLAAQAHLVERLLAEM
jgi:hypothetical protein